MTDLRQIFLKLVALNLLLSLTMLSLDAQAQQRRRGNSPPPDFGFEQPSQDRIVLDYLNINVYGQQLIKVRQLVKAKYGPATLQGQKLEQIIVQASLQSQRSEISLLINGIEVKTVRNLSYYSERVVLDLPRSAYGRHQDIVGQDIKTIELLVRGNVSIQAIILKVSNQHHRGHSQVLRAHNIYMGSERGYADQLDLSQILRTHGINQETVQEIKIIAKGMSQRAILTITASGVGALKSMHLGVRGGYPGSGAQVENISLGGRTLLSDIKLVARGQIMIQSIEVLVQSNRY